MRIVLLFATAMLLTSCSIRPEGIGFAVPMDQQDWQKIEDQLFENRDQARVAGIEVDRTTPGVIVVGRVGPYRNFDDHLRFTTAYRDYRKRMVAIGREAEIINEAELHTLAAGWTTVTHWGVSQLAFLLSTAYVQHDVAESIDFSSALGTFLIGTRQDLVAARMTTEFPAFMITTVLCKDGVDYHQCAKQYDWGLYDVYTGRQLNQKFEVKPRGKVVIDTTTFKVVE